MKFVSFGEGSGGRLRVFRGEGEVPSPLPGEVLIHVKACGVCRTDLHILEGDIRPPSLPIIPGHQVVGKIEALGEDTEGSGVRVGERVGLAWMGGNCGLCGPCMRGDENLCLSPTYTGFHRDGGFAEFVTARADFVHPIPDEFPNLEAAPLLCAGIVGFRALRLSDLKPGENIGLYGFGASAHIAIQIARYWNCSVYVFTRSEEKRRLAEGLGAEWTGSSKDSPPDSIDRAIVFAPSGEIVRDALQRIRPGGTVAVNAVHLTGIPPLDYDAHLYYEKTLRSVTASTRLDASEFLATAAAAGVRTSIEVFPLEDLDEALDAISRSKIRGSAVLDLTA